MFDEIKMAWEMDDSEETGWLIRLDYYDGYVYFTYYLQDAYFLSRINVENGNIDEPYTDSAFYCAIKDGYLYYETLVDDDYEYFDVYRVKIESQINIDKKKLYLENLLAKLIVVQRIFMLRLSMMMIVIIWKLSIMNMVKKVSEKMETDICYVQMRMGCIR